MRVHLSILALIAAAATAHAAAGAPGQGMARIAGGSYTPLFSNGARVVRVESFALDRLPVTRGEYLEFVRANPRWRRDRAPRAFVQSGYLASWAGPLSAGSGQELRRPVTEVSWFAARAYCAAQGKRLPTVDEWEYAAQADETRLSAARDPEFVQRLLVLYTSRRGAHAPVGSGFRNAYGVRDLHAGHWEWVHDFNSLLISEDSRATAGRDHPLYCAAGVIGATDPNNYPAFLRYGFRSALEGRSTTGGLGFRCAQDV